MDITRPPPSPLADILVKYGFELRKNVQAAGKKVKFSRKTVTLKKVSFVKTITRKQLF